MPIRTMIQSRDGGCPRPLVAIGQRDDRPRAHAPPHRPNESSIMKITRRQAAVGIAGAALYAGDRAIASPSAADAALTAPTPDAVIETGAIRASKYGAGGVALIFIPGLAGGAWSWTEMVQRFAPTHTVYALTLAGLDGRPATAGPVIDKAVADIAFFIAKNHLGKPFLIGHSLGGIHRASRGHGAPRARRRPRHSRRLPGLSSTGGCERRRSASRRAQARRATRPGDGPGKIPRRHGRFPGCENERP